MASSGPPFNWFDVTVIVILGLGLFRGRKNGMSRELLPTLQWVALVLVCGLGYSVVAQLFRDATSLDQLTSDVLGYLLLAFVVLLLTNIPKHKFADRLAVSNFFGASEFYLGMVSGIVRFACILLAALALLNAPFYTTSEIQAQREYDNKTYGGGMQGFSGNYIPTLQSVQEQVFEKSFVGPHIKDFISPLLINTVPKVQKPQPKPAPANP